MNKTISRLMSMFLCLALCAGFFAGAVLPKAHAATAGNWSDVATPFTDIDTTNKIINIKNEGELAYLANSIDTETTYQTYTVNLTRDLDLSAHYWSKPIGVSSTYYFGGIFDGKGFSINGLNINTWGYMFEGLFGYVSGATIKDVKVGGTISYTSLATSGNDNVGGLVGRACTSTISGCSSSVAVSMAGSGVGLDSYIGGLVGHLYQCPNITGCSATGSVTLSNGVGNVNAGGLVGYSQGPSGLATIDSCFATGAVTVSMTNGTYNVLSGGLVGNNSCTKIIDFCYASGTVGFTGGTSSSTQSIYAGGLVGYNGTSSSISDCYSSGGNVNNSGSYKIHNFGGLVGSNQGTVKNCYSRTNVSQTSSFGVDEIGGLIGICDNGSIVGTCYTTGTVSGSASVANKGAAFGVLDGTLFDTYYLYNAEPGGTTGFGGADLSAVQNLHGLLPNELKGTVVISSTYGTNLTNSGNFITNALNVSNYHSANWGLPVGGGYPCFTLAPVTNLATTTLGGYRVRLSWTAVTGATGYRIYNGTSANPTKLADTVKGNSTTTWTSSSLTTTSQYFRVMAIDENNESAGVAKSCTTTDEKWSTHKASIFSNVSGTTINITSGAELALYASYVNMGTYNDYTIKIANDIDLNDYSWDKPIGISSTYPFKGTLDGCGNHVNGLYISSQDSVYEGLVGYAQDAEFKDLTVTGSIILSSTNANLRVGGLAGYITSAATTGKTISNCVSSVTITIANSATTSGDYIGGLIGYLQPSTSSYTVSNCYSTGTLLSTPSSTSTSTENALGGLIGKTGGTASCPVTILNSHSEAKVSLNGGGIAYSGGLIGSSDYTYHYNCYATGVAMNQTAPSGSTNATGGYVGNNGANSYIYNCYATGNVTSSAATNSANRAGGFVGINNKTINNCYSTGTVTASNGTTKYFGEFVGNNIGTLSNVYYLYNAYAGSTSNNGYGNNPGTASNLTGLTTDQLAGSATITATYGTTTSCTYEGSYLVNALSTNAKKNLSNPQPWCSVSGTNSAYPIFGDYFVAFMFPDTATVYQYGGALSGGITTKPADPAKTNFSGWYSDTSYKTAWDFANDKISAETPLYARLLSSDATLSGLVVSAGALNETFSSATLDYTVNAASGTTKTTITPTSTDSGAVILVNGETVKSGVASQEIDLTSSSNKITIEVTSADGATKNTYSVTISSTATVDLSFTSQSAFWLTTFSYNSSTYDLIRYGNNTFVSADTFVSDMVIPSGCYVEVYNLSGSLIRSTQSGASQTTSSSIVSTGVTVKLYDSASNLKKTYGLVMKGDVNGDGSILGTDATILKRIVAGTYSNTNAYILAASDINADGSVLGTDATLLKRAVANTYTITQTT